MSKKFRRASAILSGVMIVGSISPTAPVYGRDNTIIEFENRELEQKILQEVDILGVGNNNGKVEQWELEELTRLIYPNSGDDIDSLVGLETAYNLKSLYINGHPIEDFSPISNLDIVALNISDTGTSDISFLPNMKSLEYLYASNNDIGSSMYGLTDVRYLTNLRYLDVSYNNLEEVTNLAALTNLETLVINNNNLTSISFVENVPWLKSLDVSNNNLSRLTGLNFVTYLEKLDISSNQRLINFTNFDELSYLTSLQELHANNLGIDNLSAFINLPVNTLSVAENNIYDLTPLMSYTTESALKVIDISSNSLNYTDYGNAFENIYDKMYYTDIITALEAVDITVIDDKKHDTAPRPSGATIVEFADKNVRDMVYSFGNTGDKLGNVTIDGIKNLTTLTIDKKVSGLGGLEHASNLVQLVIKSDVEDLSILSEISNLATLSFINTEISNPEIISELTNLYNLNISSATFEDLSMLEPLENLHYLILDNIGVSDLSPLAMLSNVSDLVLSNITAEEIDVVNEMQNLTSFTLMYSEVDTIQLTELENLQSISLTNNNINEVLLHSLPALTNRSVAINSNQINKFEVGNLPTLLELNLSNNGIQEFLAPAIDAKTGETGIMHLNLSENKLTTIGDISGLTNLTSLILTDNEFDDTLCFGEIEKLDNLLYLDVSGYDFTEEQHLQLETIIEAKPNLILEVTPLPEPEEEIEEELEENENTEDEEIEGEEDDTALGFAKKMLRNLKKTPRQLSQKMSVKKLRGCLAISKSAIEKYP
ncbi:MAG: hypothetical protein ATN35_05785 [Epulopiscium sp. Nele67-Bin004]|nr:MAG: hypothetical protein ATN35_05785 [Epulopiscium sp. Nele67-Bin004]